ncbi:MAG: histidine phosphatase family protein [Actinomycetota bacterium]|nr:histidine phosphatase family protein [Actinomycetota bacterium]
MILWVRHGQSTWNVMDRMQGQAVHPPLTELGQEQSGEAAEELAGLGVTEVLSSPAVRARETADIIAARLGLEVRIEPLLVEKGLDEPIQEVLGRIQEFLAVDRSGDVVAVSHGDTIGLAVGLLSGQRPELPANCSITSVDPRTRAVQVTRVGD